MEETPAYPWKMSCGCVQLVTEYARPGARTRCEEHGRVTLTGPDGQRRGRRGRNRGSGRKVLGEVWGNCKHCGGSGRRLRLGAKER